MDEVTCSTHDLVTFHQQLLALRGRNDSIIVHSGETREGAGASDFSAHSTPGIDHDSLVLRPALVTCSTNAGGVVHYRHLSSNQGECHHTLALFVCISLSCSYFRLWYVGLVKYGKQTEHIGFVYVRPTDQGRICVHIFSVNVVLPEA